MWGARPPAVDPTQTRAQLALLIELEIRIPRRRRLATQPCVPASEALTLSAASLVELPEPQLGKKLPVASTEGEFGLGKGSLA